MSRVRFRDQAGTVRVGTWVDDEGTPADETVAGTDGEITAGGETYRLDEVDVLAPCEPSKIVCVGLNYSDHAEEQDSELPDRPLLFLKGPNAVATHESTIELPAGKERVEHEAEIGVVVGRQARRVAAPDAMDVVAGFTCVNDVSNRDDQRREQNWIRGKAFDNAAPIGPVVAPPEAVPEDASIELRLNGEVRQSSTRSTLIFDVPTLIEEITRYVTLEPGDVIATGTPAGVGRLSDGDVVEVELEGVGTLRHAVTEADD